jgi:perosamine synthetase
MKPIKLFDPYITKAEEKAIIKVLRSKFWASGAGSGKTLQFEEEFKNYTKSNECIAVNSGTAALHLALSTLDIKNKEVILPSLSFVSTAHAIIYNGGKPVFVDVDPKTLCIDINGIKEKINQKTKAIIPVHFGGMACNLKEILKIAKKFNIHVIEDAAHSAGTSYKQKKIGSHSEMVCFSFHPVKNLAMPTGGAISINSKKSKEIKEILKSKRWCGISNRIGNYYDITRLGWNYYMNEFSAAVGIEQLKKLDKMNLKRKIIAKKYFDELDISKKSQFDEDCSYHLYWIQVRNRETFMKKMLENKIETGIHYLPIHKMTFYNKNEKLKVTEEVGKTIVTLPIHVNLKDQEINKIISLTNKYAENC